MANDLGTVGTSGTGINAYTPMLWSRKSVALLREKIIMPQLVRVDFSDDLAQAGDTVNTRKKSTLAANTVSTSTGVTVQDVSTTNIQVILNQHKDSTFRISDREATRSFMNLVDEFLDPAMLALANDVDTALLGLYTDLTANTAISVSAAANWRADGNTARTRLNKAKAPDDGQRYLVLSDDDEGAMSNLDLLVKANESGSDRTLRTGEVGRYKNFGVFRASNVVETTSPTTRHNIAFHRNAFALVMRPMATAAGVSPGAVQTRATDPDAGLSVRVTMSYNATLLSTQVTCDILYGVKTLDANLGVKLDASGF